MKILHLATDDKFLDHALPVFEAVYPNSNEAIVFSSSPTLCYVKATVSKIIKPSKRYDSSTVSMIRGFFRDCDIVVFHSLSGGFSDLVRLIPKETPAIWLGWGYDYYDLRSDLSLLLPKTKALKAALEPTTMFMMLRKFSKKLLENTGIIKSKRDVIKRMTIFAPVLPNEYKMIAKALRLNEFPSYSCWNYGTLEDNLVKGFETETISGNDILVGNSASFTCNHIETFDVLSQFSLNGRRVIAPLSYGNESYRKEIEKVGYENFGENFFPLVDFIPVHEYVSQIKNCGFVIMNHVRQQAVGNIVIMLFLGARVFVRQENPVYEFFKCAGVTISTVQELEVKPELLDSPLTVEERARNRTIVCDYWGREKSYERTRKLVDTALAVKGGKSPDFLTESSM